MSSYVESAGPPATGLRIRKKQKTRLAIYDAALELFAQQGFDATTVEQIVQRAEVSTATFFRYFPTKGDVVYNSGGFDIELLEQAIIGRPAGEDDLTAIRRAVVDRWVPALDLERVARQVRAAAKSPMLRGMTTELSAQWQGVITSALQIRRGGEGADPVCRITVFVAFAVISSASNSWMEEGFRTEFADEVDQEFDRLAQLCANWSGSVHAEMR
jgi:AcrR family transcriptional regulator